MLISIRTSEPLDSKRVKPGDFFQGTVAQSVYVGNVLAIPRGAMVTGRVVDVKKPGELKGGANIALQLTALSLGGNSYSLATDTFDTSSPGKGGYTAGNTVGAAALGAAIGAIAGGGPGAAIGAVAGTGVGLGASAATPGPRSIVPPESLIAFHLTSPATVQPVSYQDASRLEANSAPPAGRYGQRPAYGSPMFALWLRSPSSSLRTSASGLRALSVCLWVSVSIRLRLPAALCVWLSVLLPPLQISRHHSTATLFLLPKGGNRVEPLYTLRASNNRPGQGDLYLLSPAERAKVSAIAL